VKKLLIISLSSILAACGGSGGDSKVETPSVVTPPPPPPVVMHSMRVVPALSGAQVCVDKNADMICQTDEVETTTSADGSFEIEEVYKENQLIVQSIEGTVDVKSGDAANWTFYGLGEYEFVTPFTSYVLKVGDPIQHTANHLLVDLEYLVADYLEPISAGDASQQQLISYALNSFFIEYTHSNIPVFGLNEYHDYVIEAARKVNEYLNSGVTMEDLTFNLLVDGRVVPVMPEVLITSLESNIKSPWNVYSFGDGSIWVHPDLQRSEIKT